MSKKNFWSSYHLSLLLWMLALICVCIHVLVPQIPSSATVDYYTAGQNWLHGQPLYNGLGWNFIYFPQSALLYASISWLPFKVSEVIWRIILVVLMASSFYQLTTLANFSRRALMLTLTVSTLFLATGALNVGQMNITVMALALLAVVAIANKRYWLAAVLLVLNVALKPTATVFLLLLMVLYPRLILRLVIIGLLAAVIPFLFQHVGYVWQQYVACYDNFHYMVAQTDSVHWSQLYGLLYVILHVTFSNKIMYLTRGFFALLTLAISYYALWRCPRHVALLLIYSFGACFLMLFNPRTENNSYIIVLPAVVYFIFYFYTTSRWTALSFTAYLIFMVSNFVLSHLFNIPHYWIRPLGTLLFAIQLSYQLLRFNSPLKTNLMNHPHVTVIR